ncbi:MAG: hypothetical protein O2794_01575 [bacterium]|nr:hypothetical protein [bacterium]
MPNLTEVLKVDRERGLVELSIPGTGIFALTLRRGRPFIIREQYYTSDARLSSEERRAMYARAGAILRPKKK